MLYLENDHIKVTFKEAGGEMTSLFHKSHQLEYLWNGDPAFWNRHAPILFPFVGKVAGGSFKAFGQTYPMGQHGFARDMVFQVESQTNDRVIFLLESDQATYDRFPFHFQLRIIYELHGETVSVAYQVHNVDKQKLIFGVGGHPAFRCPLEEGEAMTDYEFVFEREETAGIYPITNEGLLEPSQVPYLNKQKSIDLSVGLFAKDALVFQHLESNRLTLRSKKSGHGLIFDFSDFPFLGLWSKPEGAPFVCIEPWFGHADFAGFDGDLKDKADQVMLEPGKIFECRHSMELL